jgi:hypothetical protein
MIFIPAIICSGRFWRTRLSGSSPSAGNRRGEKSLAAGCVAVIVCMLVSANASQQSPTGKTQTSQSSAAHKAPRKSKKSRKTAGNWRRHGQQKIDPQRAREIQEALIREHYLDGKASGAWDDASQKAMERYQAENGWQSKTVPDSRALIKMGLGPDHEHLLNPESAMTSQPKPPAAVSAPASPDDPANKNQPQ